MYAVEFKRPDESKTRRIPIITQPRRPRLSFPISETFGNPCFTVKFASYHIFKKDRSSRRGGSIALLVKKSLQAHATPPFPTSTLEVTGAQIATKSGPINCLSVYFPRGGCSPEELNLLFTPPVSL
jgi:hypothetical protein